MRIIKNVRANRNQQGFSLVEVLIALIIMSVGMLGIAGLYVQSMQAGRTSLFRHHAVTLAGDVADRIRANPRAGVAYTGVGVDFNCVGAGIDCNEVEMAATDILLWSQQADESIPNGDVAIAFDNGTTPPSYTIAVTWDEPGETEDSPLNYTIVIPVMEL